MHAQLACFACLQVATYRTENTTTTVTAVRAVNVIAQDSNVNCRARLVQELYATMCCATCKPHSSIRVSAYCTCAVGSTGLQKLCMPPHTDAALALAVATF